MNTVKTLSVRGYTRRSMLSAIYVEKHKELEREYREEVRVNRLIKAMERELRDLVAREAR